MHGNLRDVHLRWRRDLERIDRASAAALLRRIVADGGAPRLRTLLAQGLPGAAVAGMSDQAVVEALAARVQSGQVALFSRRASGGTWTHRDEPEAQPAQEAVLRAPAETTWVEVRLIDEEGEPVPGERYRIKTPDGTVREGKLNYLGKARVNAIEQAGECLVCFPDLDADAWEPV